MYKFWILTVLFILPVMAKSQLRVQSPSGNLVLNFDIDDKGQPGYSLSYKGKSVIERSALGFEANNTGNNKEIESFRNAFEMEGSQEKVFDETWKPVWGEVSNIRNNYNELVVRLKSKDANPVKYNVVFRVFNDGIGFRYEFPKQEHLNYFTVRKEKTEFKMPADHTAFWIPGDYDNNEYTPFTTRLSGINASIGKTFDEISVKTHYSDKAVQTPLMMKSDNGLYINIHEAALENYTSMQLELDPSTLILHAGLVPNMYGDKAYLQAPAKTPWRTVIVSDKATDILASKTILNLNEPSRIKDPSWIKPVKYVGIWWEMHIGVGSWDYSGTQDGSNNPAPEKNHSANTANAKRYIDFAAKHGFDGVLIEGWNTGWEDWFGNWKENVFDFITPYPDFDLKELQRYAASKNVKIIMHHETSGSVTNYERFMDTAYRFMKEHGYDAVKTGYVGKIIPRGEHHDGQWMVDHYNRVAQKTADYKIMVNMHEPVRPTGMHRTYPNWLACEAARGMEFNGWSKGNRPDHETILPFTRLMGGPMDYTPGIFQLDLSFWDSSRHYIIHTTLAKQLALYLTMYSPIQMAADLPQAYEKRPDAFQFIKDVPVDWQDSKYISAEPGHHITVARKDKNSEDWYLGAITDENGRKETVELDFLTPGKKYEATIYADAKGASWDKNPQPYSITRKTVTSRSTLTLDLAPGGGTAIRFKAL